MTGFPGYVTVKMMVSDCEGFVYMGEALAHAIQEAWYLLGFGARK